ncbi:MAG: TonB-dependent receptor plug domain-containing protein [Vicinamibacterales bacterium]
MKVRGAAAWAIGLVLLGGVSATAQTTAEALRRMSLAELLQVDVTTVSRAPESAMRVPAAVFVITADDIRRSGAQSLPEALRLAPGLQVSRLDAGKWAIGVRGFGDRLARSMLVLIDGRAVYNPLFAGTYWETQDVLLADVERIEVIRGPGGTLWGANAVNGIINVITKSAAQTAGTRVSVGAGTSDRVSAAVRYGAAAGTRWHYRVYGKAFDRASEFHATGDAYDGLRFGQGGARADWAADGRQLTIQGDVYDGRLGQRERVTSYDPPYTTMEAHDAPLSGGNVLARWDGPAGRLGRLQVQGFYAHTSREERPVAEQRDTVDLDLQHTPPPLGRHRLAWGAGARVTSGRISAASPTAFTPERRTDRLFTAFLQDEVALVPRRLAVTLGAKVEHNDYSGVEWQPGVRAVWTPDDRHALWGAVTRAVRTPSRVETDYATSSLVVDGAVPVFVRLEPNPSFRSERLVAYESGYRIRPGRDVYVSASAFYNTLDDVLSTEIHTARVEPAGAPVRVLIPVQFGNGLTGHSRGLEVTTDVRLADWWRWTANYSYIRIALAKQEGSRDGASEARDEGRTPRHQVQLRSSVDLPGALALDVAVRSATELTEPGVPGYAVADLRLGWRMTPRLELELVGQDLGARPWHVEWPADAGGNVGIRRSVYAGLVWQR